MGAGAELGGLAAGERYGSSRIAPRQAPEEAIAIRGAGARRGEEKEMAQEAEYI